MNHDEQGITADDVIVDFGERVRRGYDPAAVDAHLQHIARGVAELQSRAEGESGDESLELVLKATRRSVEEALAEARERANRILDDAAVRAASTVAAAEAEATELRSAAESTARQLTQEAETKLSVAEAEAAEAARTAGEQARERHAEISRLLGVREVELAGLDEEIARRQESLRVVGLEILRVADGVVDLRDPEPTPDDALHAQAQPSLAPPAPDDHDFAADLAEFINETPGQ
jgi:DivIVA domain-containing protein